MTMFFSQFHVFSHLLKLYKISILYYLDSKPGQDVNITVGKMYSKGKYYMAFF